MTDWEYRLKMEDMGEEALKERIAAALAYENPHQIRTIPYLGEVEQTVTYDCAELVARCPVTGYLDFYRIKLILAPGRLLPELKSLKFYYYGFADLPISHEHLAAKIYQEFRRVIEPVSCRLKLTVGIRGGIETTIEVGDKEL